MQDVVSDIKVIEQQDKCLQEELVSSTQKNNSDHLNQEQCQEASNGQQWYLGTLPPELSHDDASIATGSGKHGLATSTRKRVSAQETPE